jgi:hypothetical protein
MVFAPYRLLSLIPVLILLPSIALAQAAITGVVRDVSGAVLPGVTVEAASPALIEKVRTAVSDGTGQYRIIDLRPGTYSVTFTLPGFKTVRREGIDLAGSFVATIAAELAVGELSETLTVTGQTPLVDVQSARRQEVIDRNVIESVPAARTAFGLATLIPALTSNNPQDAGGANSINLTFLTTHGSRATDQRITLDGLSTNSAEGAGQFSAYMPNITSTQEMAVDYAGGTAEMETGGVRVNVIPREGGNVFRGTAFVSGSGERYQGDNLDETLRTRGLPYAPGIVKLWDYNPGLGGPILRDRVWFYTSWRYNGEEAYTSVFQNANAGDPARWDYVPSDRRGRVWKEQHSANLRLTWQVSAKNKISAFHDSQWRCACPPIRLQNSAESGRYLHYPWADIQSLTWSSPRTNRLLFEAGVQRHPEQWHASYPDSPHPSGQIRELPDFIPVIEQSSGLQYRGSQSGGTTNTMVSWRSRGAMSYVTGSHAFKVGFEQHHATRDWFNWPYAGGENLQYRFNNGVPNQLTQYLRPELILANIGTQLGAYVQDQWTFGRATAMLGLRYEHLDTYYPEAILGPTRFAPTRNQLLPKRDQLKWNDITPRMSASYDLFGDGRTAIKGILNKYVNAVGLQGFFGDGSNPVNLYGGSTTRSWNDANRNFAPDCDLLSPLANAECGPMNNVNFGKPLPASRVDPAILRGWGVRPYNWEVGASLQHQMTDRLAFNVGYFRRSYGNAAAKYNAALSGDSYDRFTITAPVDSRLPNGGGYTIGPLYDLKPAFVGLVDNYYTAADTIGKWVQNWRGADFNVTTRLAAGVLLQGGVSTGRTVIDACDLERKRPEVVVSTEPPSAAAALATTVTVGPYCHQQTGYLTNVKGLGSYTIPRVDIQISASFTAQPALATGAQNAIPSMATVNYVASNALIAPSLGRNLSGGAANATVNLIAPGSVRGDMVRQVDVSIGKIVRMGGTRTNVKVEIFNLFNGSAVLSEGASYGATGQFFRQPIEILQARFAKFGVQFDF